MTFCHALKLDGVCFGELDVLSKIPSMGVVVLGEMTLPPNIGRSVLCDSPVLLLV